MFKLNEKPEVKGNILKCNDVQCSRSEKSTINTANSQRYINIPRDNSVIFLLNSY